MKTARSLMYSLMACLAIAVGEAACDKNSKNQNEASHSATADEKQYFEGYLKKSEQTLQSLKDKSDPAKLLAELRSIAKVTQRTREQNIRGIEIAMIFDRDYGLALSEIRTLSGSNVPAQTMEKINQGRAKLEKDAAELRARLDQLRSEFEKTPAEVVAKLKASDSKSAD